MDNRGSNHSASSYVKPLVISFAGIIFCTLALAAYHFIVLRCCVRPQHMQQQQQRTRNNNDNNNNRNCNKNSCRVQEEFLNQIPVIKYTINTSDHAFGFDQSECSICLGELEDGDLVRQLPPCNHIFHNHCTDPWFKEHASCPFCRSPITCECESMVSTASENAGQQRVSHENPSDHHHPLMDDDVSGSTSISRLQQPRHSLCMSSHISSHMQKKPQVSSMWLKRSLSMDPSSSSSYIAITIQRDQEIACECESRVPTTSENGGQQRVSHENPSDHHHQLMDDYVSGSTSTSRLQQPRHSLYISSHISSQMQKKPQVSGMWLKRSLSMDQSSSYIAITIQRDQEIASGCESRVPTTSENAGQQRVSHENPSDHHHQLMDDDVSGSTSTSRLQQPRHSLYISSHISSHKQKRPQVSGMWLKRSLSMNQSSSCIDITIQRDQEIAPTSASTKWFVKSQYNYKPRPLKHLDHMSSVLLMRLRSFSKLRNSRSGRSNGIFPK